VAVPQTGSSALARAHPTVANTVDRLLFEERTRWAMHVHDGLTQSVTSAVLELQTLRHRIEDDPAGAIEALSDVESAIRADLRDVRQLLFEMQEDLAHDAAPLAMLAQALASRWKLRVRVLTEGDLGTLDDGVYETAHGIVAEALANVAKHSGVGDARIRFRLDDRSMRIEIEDRGNGVPITAVTDQDQHFGIRMMRTRAAESGGTFEMESTPGHGTRVIAVLPVGGQGEQG